MLTFYPGPSKIYPQVEQYLQEAFQLGILQMNHRSKPFMDLLKETLELLHEKLDIPNDYSIVFTSSATECWEIVAQSFVKNSSLHSYNGAFGAKWFDYASKIHPSCRAEPFSLDEFIPTEIHSLSEVICFTQNETSNGTQVRMKELRKLQFPQSSLIAMDATSSMAGIELEWNLIDICLASVQKCFGLPSGMGILVCSPKAVEQAEKVAERNHYNSFLFALENFRQYQTPYTPNILNIFLLNRVLKQVAVIQEVSKKIKARAKRLYEFIEKETHWKLVVANPALRSDTVLAVSGTTEQIEVVKQKALQHQVTLGNGYGAWKNTTFRIANFPAIEDWEFETLKTLLKP